MSRVREAAYLHALRAAELDRALATLDGRLDLAAARVLEIGGADGHVARLLAARCATIASVDIAVPPQPLFPVQPYDGHRLPFADGRFDLVYSSHVMEHVGHFAAFQTELARVLRPGGFALHVVPTAVWRFWTLLAHYPALPKLLLRRGGGTGPATGAAGKDAGRRRGFGGAGHLAMRLLAAAPHGETGSAVAELRHFSMACWRRRFAEAGWTLLHSGPVGLFYTGYILSGGRLSLAARRRLAGLAGSSSGVLLLAPARSAGG